MNTLLITSVGSNTAISIIKAIKLIKNFPVRIIGTDLNDKDFCAGAAMVDNFYQIPHVSKQASQYENALINIIANEKVSCVIPVHDLEIKLCSVIAKKYQNITFWAINQPDIIELCSDKQKINSVLAAAGISVPIQFDHIDSVTENDLPIIIKPNKGVSSAGISIIYTKTELLAIKEIFDNSYLVQQFVVGKEYTADCYSSYKDSEFKGAAVRERIETKAGISTKGMVVENEKITKICEKIHSILNYKGASNIQFIIQNDIPFFIEINPRFSGAGILSYTANFNSPYFTLLESMHQPLPDNIAENITYGLKMTRYWQEVFS